METSSEYDENGPKNFLNWAKTLQTQMRPHMCDTIDLVSVISFLFAFKLACHTKGNHDSVAIWFFHFFMKGSTGAERNALFMSEINLIAEYP